MNTSDTEGAEVPSLMAILAEIGDFGCVARIGLGRSESMLL